MNKIEEGGNETFEPVKSQDSQQLILNECRVDVLAPSCYSKVPCCENLHGNKTKFWFWFLYSVLYNRQAWLNFGWLLYWKVLVLRRRDGDFRSVSRLVERNNEISRLRNHKGNSHRRYTYDGLVNNEYQTYWYKGYFIYDLLCCLIKYKIMVNCLFYMLNSFKV